MTRRRWLASSLPAPLLAPSLAPAAPPATIESFEAFRVPVNRRGSWLLFRLGLSNGLWGIGDASHGGPDDRRVTQLAGLLFQALRGRDVFCVEYLRQRALDLVRNYGRPAAVALGGIEQCLWDLQGQLLGVPVYALFGGALRRRVLLYANINRSTVDRTPAGFARMAERAVQAGFHAVKLAPFDGMPGAEAGQAELERHTELGIACAEAVRRVIGPARELLVDVHGRMDLERGLRLVERLEPLRLYWLEEVTRSLEDLAVINQKAPMPIAGGESVFGVEGFYAYIKAGAADILMPDIKYCGGMLELKKIAAMAEGAGLLVSPHGPASPVGTIAAAHVCATLPNFQILEYSFGEVAWRAELVDPPEPVEKGELVLGERPGLGFRLNPEALERYAVKAA